MLTPEYLDKVPDAMVERYAEAEQSILEDMAKRISAFDDFIPAAQWQLMKLREMGNSQDFILKKLSAMTGETKAALKKMLADAGIDALEDDDNIYRAAGLAPPPFAESPALQMALQEGLTSTMGLFENMTHTTAQTATGQLERALDRAWLQIQSGAFSPQEAIRMAVKDLCEQGVGAKRGAPSIRYPSGHVDKLDVVVRRAVLTGVNQTALHIQEARMDEMGCDLVEVSAHAGARTGDGLENPGNHSWWQGKVYSRSGSNSKYPNFEECTGYGTGEGLGGWNCRHSFFPFFEGISRPAYTESELEELNAPKYEYKGQKLTEYEATQRQRYIERQIRRWKRETAAMKAAGLDPGEAAAKLKKWQGTLRDFLNQTGLKRHYDRETVVDKPKKAENPVEKKHRHDIIKTDKDGGDQMPLAEKPKLVSSDVLSEYQIGATPGTGDITYEDGYVVDTHQDEIVMAKWIRDTFGGDIKLLVESEVEGEKRADYLWKGKLWDLKTISTEKAANTAIKRGLSQIKSNPGGVILNYGQQTFSIDLLKEVIDKRMQWLREGTSVDILIVSDWKTIKVLRYKK